MKRLASLILGALLAGCAAAPPPRGDAGENTGPREAPVKTVNRVDALAQRCMALAMYWEARGEGRQGMLAVGAVVLNRVADRRFPDSVCAVVHQGGEHPPCQFSWWCDGKSDRPTEKAAWAESLNIAHSLLMERPRDPTNGALYFHNTSVSPSWRAERTARIGNHVFYR